MRSDLKNRNTRFLIGARAARSVGQGVLATDFALYLRVLKWSPAAIGALFMGSLLLSAGLSLVSGPMSDRFGRRRFLILYESGQLLAALLAFLSSRPLIIVAAALVGGFGHGLNGGAGPFAPAELAWLSETVSARRRHRVYSLNMAVGFGGMGVGALLAALPDVLEHWLAPPRAFRLLFLIVIAGALVCLALLWATRERPPVLPAPVSTANDLVRRRENHFLRRLVGVNVLNGAAIGLIGPLMAYWFAVRFGKTPGQIGPVIAAGLFLTAVSSVALTRLARRFGVVRTVTAMRLAGAALLFVLPFAPTFGLAAVVYMLRSAMNRGTAGARQSLNLGSVSRARRGLAASLNSASLQIPRALGPLVTGVLFGAGEFALPFVVGAGLQLLYVYFYHRMFRGEGRGDVAVDP